MKKLRKPPTIIITDGITIINVITINVITINACTSPIKSVTNLYLFPFFLFAKT